MTRGAEDGDLAALAGILGDWGASAAGLPKLHMAAQDLRIVGHLRERGILRVAGRPARGFLARRAGEIDALYLAPGTRREGIGRALVVGAMAAEPAPHLWTCRANAPARAFCAALGFREIDRTEGDNAAGLPGVRLEWRRNGA